MIVNIEFTVAGRSYSLSVEERQGEFHLTSAGATRRVLCRRLTPHLFALDFDGRTRLVHIAEDGDRKFVRLAGREVCLEKPRRDQARGAAETGTEVSEDGIVETPMPGKIVKISVGENDRIEKGASLLVVESMKMENTIAAPWDAVVKKIHVAEGDQTHLGQPLMEIEKIE
jgi:biotin carboxyl carrier protein